MVLTMQQPRAGGFLVSEASGTRSRESVTVASGQDLRAGAVLGVVGGKYVAFDAEAETGAEEVAGVLYADVDATGGDTPGVAIVRDAEVRGSDLVVANPADRADAIAGLEELGVIAR